MAGGNFWANLQKWFNGLRQSDNYVRQKNITATQARNMQNAYINAEKCAVNPPYEEIAKQLYADKEEIFNAACYYLEKIGLQKKHNKEQIVRCLQTCAKSSELSEKRQQKIAAVIARIKAK